jgi:Carbon-nitrogen hydrolase
MSAGMTGRRGSRSFDAERTRDESAIADAGEQTAHRLPADGTAVGKKARNVEQSLVMLADAARCGAQLAVLPELCNSGYVFATREEAFGLAEEVPNGPTCRPWAELAARHGIEIVAGPRVVRERRPRGRKGGRLDWTDITKPRPFGDAVTRC